MKQIYQKISEIFISSVYLSFIQRLRMQWVYKGEMFRPRFSMYLIYRMMEKEQQLTSLNKEEAFAQYSAIMRN